MKLFASFSEAIREGAKLRPQAFGAYFDGGTSCAVGAAHEAITGKAEDSDAVALTEGSFPYMQLCNNKATCPQCTAAIGSLLSTVTHLNDEHKWTRERIADWLETEEEKLGFVTVVESESVPFSAESQAFVGELR